MASAPLDFGNVDSRDRDPRDPFVHGLELPRGLERELVQDEREIVAARGERPGHETHKPGARVDRAKLRQIDPPWHDLVTKAPVGF